VGTSRRTSLSVFSIERRSAPAPATGLKDGLPSDTMSSVGSVATAIFGGFAASVPSSSGVSLSPFFCASVAWKARSAMSEGGPPMERHGPFASGASYHHFLPPER